MAKKKRVSKSILSERDRHSIKRNKKRYPKFPDDYYKPSTVRIKDFYNENKTR